MYVWVCTCSEFVVSERPEVPVRLAMRVRTQHKVQIRMCSAASRAHSLGSSVQKYDLQFMQSSDGLLVPLRFLFNLKCDKDVPVKDNYE